MPIITGQVIGGLNALYLVKIKKYFEKSLKEGLFLFTNQC
jgi:hypothetical protein